MRYCKSRSYYEIAKERFANKSYSHYTYSHDKKNGEICGYTLEPPMKLEKIENYEHTFNLQLPKDFRNYLLNISSETIGCYPYKVTLYEPMLIFIHESQNVCPGYYKDNSSPLLDSWLLRSKQPDFFDVETGEFIFEDKLRSRFYYKNL